MPMISDTINDSNNARADLIRLRTDLEYKRDVEIPALLANMEQAIEALAAGTPAEGEVEEWRAYTADGQTVVAAQTEAIAAVQAAKQPLKVG